MKTIEVTVAKIYLVEGSPLLNKVLNYLHDDAQVSGVSVYRAVSGFGETGVHSTSIMDLSFALPIIVEFFDSPEKMMGIAQHLSTIVKPKHLLLFSGQTTI